MADPELDRELKAYLEAEKRSKRDGYTIANVLMRVDALVRTVNGVNLRVSALEADRDDVHDRLDTQAATLTKHAASIVTIKRRIRRDANDEEMDTGQYDLDEIKRELASIRQKKADSERAKAEDVVWWKRSIIMWVVGGFAFIATTTITILVTLAIVGKR